MEIPPAVAITTNDEKGTGEKPEIKTEADTSPKKKSLKEKISDWVKGGKELRKSSSRNEKVFMDVADDVRVRIDKDQNDWMMGVKNQKLVITNHSEYLLHSASIEVLYYAEDKSLLEKKKLEVTGLSSKKAKTISVPDHKMADHIEASIASAKAEIDQK